MRGIPSKCVLEPTRRLGVAAHVARHSVPVPRGVAPALQNENDASSSHERVLRPRVVRKAPDRPRSPEDIPSGQSPRRDGPRRNDADTESVRGVNEREVFQDGARGRLRPSGDFGSSDLSRHDERLRDRERDGYERRDRRQGEFRGRSQQRRDERSSGRGRDPAESSSEAPLPAPLPPLDPKMARSPRYLALQQLIRVEEEGAYVGLVSGSPSAAAAAGAIARSRGGTGGGGKHGDDGADQFEEAGEEELGDGSGGPVGTVEDRGPRGRNRANREPPLDPRDQRLIKELVAGVTRLRRRLDYVASNLSQQTPADMQSAVRQILRLGLFELMERKLAPHALNEHVQLAKAVLGPGAGSFVNGVLRSASRCMDAGTLPTPEFRAGIEGSPDKPASGRDAMRQLALQHSHPNWMVSRWLTRFGHDGTEALLRCNNQPPVYTVRVNTLRRGATAEALLERLRAAGVEAEPSALLPTEFIRVRSGLQKLLSEGFVSDGSLFVQDESAGLVVSLLDPQPGERLLDCCAARETLFAAARMRGRGSIAALDASAARLGALRNSAELAGVSDLVSTHAEDLRSWSQRMADRAAWQQQTWGTPRDPEGARREDAAWERAGGGRGSRITAPEQPGALLYDKVLLDAPCTGTGVLSKRADLRWRRTPEQLEQLVELQDELLEAAAPLVAPGGVLVYSTCSIEEEEDHHRVRGFLARHPEFQLEAAGPPAAPGAPPRAPPLVSPGTGPLVPPEVVTPEGFMATLPHVHNTDGAFAARMRRRV